MTGTKRTAPDTGSSPARATRSKAAKTEDQPASPTTDEPASKGKKSGKKGAPAIKTPMPFSAFKARALPLHANITHTPPSVSDSEAVPAASADPGFVAATTLVPGNFNTGSYGWKGSKRLQIELMNDTTGEKEKVTVQLQINATVLKSKDVEDTEDLEQTLGGPDAVMDNLEDKKSEEEVTEEQLAAAEE